jgi:hypothetical protein
MKWFRKFRSRSADVASSSAWRSQDATSSSAALVCLLFSLQECLRVKRRVLFGAATLSVYGCPMPHTPVIASDSARVCIAGDFVSGTVSMRVQQLGALPEHRAAATSSVHTWRLWLQPPHCYSMLMNKLILFELSYFH